MSYGILRVIQRVSVFMFCFVIDQNIHSGFSQGCAEPMLLLKSNGEELQSLPCWKMSMGEIVRNTRSSLQNAHFAVHPPYRGHV